MSSKEICCHVTDCKFHKDARECALSKIEVKPGSDGFMGMGKDTSNCASFVCKC